MRTERTYQAALDEIRRLEADLNAAHNEIVNLKKQGADPAVTALLEELAKSKSKFAARARELIEV